MLRSLPFGRTVVALLAVGFLALIGIGIAATWLSGRAARDAELVTEANGIQGAALELYLALRETEISQRSYLLTEDPEYLRTYQLARRGALPSLEKLARLTNDHPDQVADVKQLRPLVAERLSIMERTIELMESDRRGAAIALVKTNMGRDLNLRIGRLVGVIIGRETERLQAGQASSREASSLLGIVDVIGLALVAGLALLSLTVIGRSLQELRSAGRELSRVNQGLEATIDERTQEIRRANDEIQRFAYIVSHDLRAPLVNVMGFTSELEGVGKAFARQLTAVRQGAPQLLDADAVEAAETDLPESLGFIRTSTAKMDRLINAILKMSRDGRRVLTPAPIDMAALLQQVAASLTMMTETAGAEIVIESAPDLTSDRLAVEQIFSNLLENAVKYLQPGRAGRIVVRGRPRTVDVVYEIQDNGRGIDPKDHARVFELFRRAGAQDQAGEGLGLAFVQTNIRRLGGSISLASQAGEGSTFTLIFPRVLKLAEDKGLGDTR